MGRLPGFDYKKPFFYMVTLKGARGLNGNTASESRDTPEIDPPRQVLQSTAPQPIFERDWHDWIVKKDGQLAAFTRYISENPRRAWLRHKNARYFGCVRKLSFAGREWFAYGNTALLELPVIEPFRCSRKWAEGFGERWHPTRNKEALCAKGRMLFLSLWPAENGKPDNATLYRRCHEMGDIVVAATRGNT